MAKHLQSCESIRRGEGGVQKFLIRVSGGAPYWLFIEADASSTLEELDAFLRGVWVECCGHMSCFTINGQEYHVDPHSFSGERLRDMKVRLDKLLRPGMSFGYEYDFGTTTELGLQVMAAMRGKAMKQDIRLLARNNAPEFKCAACGSVATEICSQCCGEGECTFCKKCIKKHECGEEMALPIVNSPRTGQCAYEG